MCGIGGQFAYRDARIDRDELQAVSLRMSGRGPDGVGAWYAEDERVGFVHRRLAIIDVLDRAAQPMRTADGRYVVTFNGEIYNYEALRAGLIAKGYVFRTTSDTEVLLHLYGDKGDAMVAELRGMFAFAIWDEPRRRLLLARDPYGIKPLYYADDGRVLRFASQVKALMAGGALSREPDPAGVVGFHLFGAVPDPFTWYRDIAALPAGSFLVLGADSGPRVTRYHSIAAEFRDAEWEAPETDGEAVKERVRDSLRDSVKHHLVADVPVGLFLSAGVDSGALLGLMRDESVADIETVTLSFDEFDGQHADEAPIATEVARRYGARHTRRVVSHREFADDLPRILDAMDQPTIDGLNTWFVSKAAHELGLKVAISGLGGDELFAGYPSFHDVPRAVKAVGSLTAAGSERSVLAPLMRLARRVAGDIVDPKLAALLSFGGDYPGAYLVRRGVFMPDELSNLLDAEICAEGLRRLDPLAHIAERLSGGPCSAYAKVATLESSLYMRNQLLRDTDWASMAHSLEVRTPLVDSTLLRGLAPHLIRGLHAGGKAALGASPRLALPESVTRRAKTGFSTPIADWLKADRRSQAWQRVAKLAAPKCRWARRWAYTVHQHALPST